MPVQKSEHPRCIVIAGPNGAGKTTFARAYLLKEHVVHFVNADLIASGLSPLKPELASLAAGRLVLQEVERLAAARADFAFESTLSGIGYVKRLKEWKRVGYQIEIEYIQLGTPRLAIRRIENRVKLGGHSIPEEDALRRFDRSWNNFVSEYRLLSTDGVCGTIRGMNRC